MSDALLSAGNMYLLRRDYETALPFYAEIYSAAEEWQGLAYSHWKSAWLTYRMGKKDDASGFLKNSFPCIRTRRKSPMPFIARPDGENEGDKKLARAFYQKLAENYRYFYYANLARERMAQGWRRDVDPPVLDSLPRPQAPPNDWEAPADNVRAQKAQLLANAALYDFAVAEMQAASAGSPPWEARSVAEIYNEQGSYIRAIETLKRAVPAISPQRFADSPAGVGKPVSAAVSGKS